MNDMNKPNNTEFSKYPLNKLSRVSIEIPKDIERNWKIVEVGFKDDKEKKVWEVIRYIDLNKCVKSFKSREVESGYKYKCPVVIDIKKDDQCEYGEIFVLEDHPTYVPFLNKEKMDQRKSAFDSLIGIITSSNQIASDPYFLPITKLKMAIWNQKFITHFKNELDKVLQSPLVEGKDY